MEILPRLSDLKGKGIYPDVDIQGFISVPLTPTTQLRVFHPNLKFKPSPLIAKSNNMDFMVRVMFGSIGVERLYFRPGNREGTLYELHQQEEGLIAYENVNGPEPVRPYLVPMNTLGILVGRDARRFNTGVSFGLDAGDPHIFHPTGLTVLHVTKTYQALNTPLVFIEAGSLGVIDAVLEKAQSSNLWPLVEDGLKGVDSLARGGAVR